METINLSVQGMTCGGCSGRLKKVLEKNEGVDNAQASHEDNSCVISFDPEKVNRDKLVAIITGANFTVEN